MKFEGLKKVKKRMASFMLFLSLSGTISQPISVLAETKALNQAQSSNVVEESSKKATEISSSDQEENQSSEKQRNDTSKTNQTTETTGTILEDNAKNELPKVITKEVPKGMEQYFFGLKDIQSADSFSKQEEMAKNSQEWQSMLQKDYFLRSGMLLSENGRQYVNMTRITPSGTYYTHDYIIRWRLNGEDVFCLQEGAFTQAGISYNQQSLDSVISNTVIKSKLSRLSYFGYYSNPTMNNYVLTQVMVWDTIGGSFVNYGNIGQSTYENFKNTTNAEISKFERKPSFDGKTYTVKSGEEIEIKDTSGAFSSWSDSIIANTCNVQVRKSGNSLFVRATNESKNGYIDLSYLPSGTKGIGTPFAYVNSNAQTLGRLFLRDPNKSTVNIKVLKNGNAKIKKVDADTGKAISGAKFKLSYGGKQVEVVTNANGEADLKDVPHGTKVTIQEIQAANGYVINKTPQTVTIEANQTVTATFKNKKQVGRLDLIKEDKETGNQPQGSARLDGAVYGLFETNGQKVKEVTLKKSGDKVTGSFENMQIMHDYYVQEVKAPEGYNLDTTKYPVNIAYAGQEKEIAVQSMTVKDQVIKGGVEIVKIGDKPLVKKVMDKVTGKSDNVKPKLEGAEFTITSKTTGKPVKVITTDKDGKASTGKTLPYDSYIMTETKTPEGYLTIEPIEFTISEEDQKFFWVLEDKIIEARLHLVKVDAETGKTIPLKDTTFKIWDRWANDGKGDYVSMRVPNSLKVSDEFKTNEEGELVTSDSLAFGNDRYEIRELRAPEGYLLATEPVVFSVTEADAGGVITIKFENMPQKGQVKIHKTGEKGISTVEKEGEYGKYVDIQYDQVDLADVKFKVRAAEDIKTPDGTIRLAKGEYIQKDGKDLELVTNDLGDTLSDPNLYIGKYEAIETEAPSGYVMQEKPIPFEIKYKGQLVELSSTDVEVENPLQKINVYGYKKQEVVTDWEDGKPTIELENAKNGQVFGLYVGEEGLQIGYNVLPEGNALAYSKVEDGKISFEGLTLPNVPSNYYLQEVNAGKDHVLDETKYTFQYVPSSNEKEHNIHVFADGYAENKEILTKMSRKEIENKLAYTDVELIKTDNLGNKPLEGVEFQLIRVDGKKETVIDTYKTDKDGKIAVKKLPTGSYKFKEIKPLNWYYPNTDDLSFEVTPETNGQEISLKAVNKRQSMKITTLLATVDGKKEADPTVDNTLRDKVEIKGAEVGHTYYIETPYVDPATKKVITTVESTYTAKAENETIYVDIPIAKNTMKDGQKGVATHYIYYDKEKTKEVGKEDDLKNKDQTVTFKTPKFLPKTNESSNVLISMIGLVLFVCASVVVFVRRKSHK
ncbi:LPXTG cell wall anchor domain-containing protein [Enterococcus faecium]|uniref:SpaA isopeptide-forming pilin-related protein n=1 Tax=Enterococcus TaxID=1350 RepID=UPI000CF0696B|nr:SpaA isopeptide-forming pilin-related protein [Enterococcus faecium]MBG7803696.1 LPXTG cell wall anchor domain-containing protein [Enterococcus faecium]MBG7953224.1 LPXTG cell wall anchor domain-containing protein [Enterococcus faecium]MBG8283142.1 LPXTG cell wall anchor domain-containing protein [Enterococcus faecium]MBH0946049.1 LPXTG cell wall anchor domain-containing protein [Enterococcus faecium]MBJ1178780.1 LPXTG cell wall anchor domain-containing protein [Enterococcus faecium]